MLFSPCRTEFKAYKDVKLVKAIKAPDQYKPPVKEASLETSYSATYKGEQMKAQPTDNKLVERRRIRSLYSEPGKEAAKVSGCPPTDPPMEVSICRIQFPFFCYGFPLSLLNSSNFLNSVSRATPDDLVLWD